MVLGYICKYFDLSYSQFCKLIKPVLLISLAYFIPFLLDRTPFLDDYAWTVRAGMNGLNIGRPFTPFLLSLFSLEPNFHSQAPIINLQPGYQIVSIILLVLAATLVTLKINTTKSTKNLYLITFAFLANPFLLENFSYSISCVSMTLGYTFAIFASLNNKNSICDIVIGSILLSLSLGLYQISLNLFCASVLIIFITLYLKRDPATYTFVRNSLFKIFISIFTYKFLIINEDFHSSYYLEHSQIFAFNEHFIQNLYNQILKLSQYPLEIFYSIKTFGIFSIISLSSFLIFFLKGNFKRKGVRSLLLIIFAIALVLLFSFGFLALLQRPIIAPRVFSAFSLTILLIFSLYNNLICKKFPSLNLLMLIPIFSFFTLAYNYSNARKLDSLHSYNITETITSTLNQYKINPKTLFFIEGHIARHPVSQKLCNENPILHKLLHSNLKVWYFDHFVQYYFKPQYHFEDNYTTNLRSRMCRAKVIHKDPNFIISRHHNKYWVALKHGSCYKKLSHSHS